MLKIRVHELARELGKENKDILDYLTEKGYKGKTAVSSVPDDEADFLRSKFGAPKQQSKPAEKEAPKEMKSAPVKKAEEAGSPEKKKKTIIRVFRSQNASGQLQQHRPQKPMPAPAPKPAEPVRKAPEEPKAAPAAQAAPKIPEAPAVKPEAVKKPEAAEVRKPAEASAPAPVKAAPVTEEAKKPVQEHTAPAVHTVPETHTAPESHTAPAVHTAPAASPAASSAPAAEKPAPAATTPVQASAPAPAVQHPSAPVRPAPTSRPQGQRTPYSQNRPQGQGRSSYGQGQGRPSYGQGQGRPSYGQGQGRPSYGQGQGRPSYGQGQGRPSYGQGQSRPSYGQGQGRPSYGQGQGRPSYGQGQGRPSYGQGQSRPPYGQGQSRPPYGQAKAPETANSDGALAHKTTRDYKGKNYEKAHEDRRELGKRGSNRSGQTAGRQFSRIPKALQNQKPKEQEQKKEAVTEIKVPERITIRDLADKMKIQPSAIVKELFLKGEMVTVNHEVEFDKAAEIALDFNVIAEPEEKEDVIGELLAEGEENTDEMVARPPVVCVMGHVDHGKTSLLDAIRNTHVTEKEAGGITQHIGAYMVTIKGKKITFLDTPGHEAFTAMRMRGAKSTDIAVLVVAADDGVMPQTVEAINHAKAANVDIIVAVNKIDKPNANIERVKQELSEYGLISEDWGGQTIFCPVSARTHEGLDNLLEMILLTAEVDELKANPNRKARGIVLEAKLDKGKGPVATILIQKGTLHQGDFIACGSSSGKVRAMTDEKGKHLHKATPSMPIEIIGLSSVPEAGEVLVALDTDKEAKDFAATFVTEGKKDLLEETKHQMSLDDLYDQIKAGSLKELPIVIKADVQGSVEAVRQSLLKLSNDEIIVKIIHGGVGAINESDVELAAASNAIIIGFNVKPDATAKTIAEQQKVEIKLYSVIYQAIEDVERAIKGMRAAVYEEQVIGHAEIRQIFKASGVGNIAGSYVKDGIFERGCKVRVFHDGDKIYDGELASLKRFKDDAKEVKEGFECGLVFKDFNDFQEEDTVEAYKMVEVKQD